MDTNTQKTTKKKKETHLNAMGTFIINEEVKKSFEHQMKNKIHTHINEAEVNISHKNKRKHKKFKENSYESEIDHENLKDQQLLVSVNEAKNVYNESNVNSSNKPGKKYKKSSTVMDETQIFLKKYKKKKRPSDNSDIYNTFSQPDVTYKLNEVHSKGKKNDLSTVEMNTISDNLEMLKNCEKKNNSLFTPNYNGETDKLIENVYDESENKGNEKYLTGDVSDECVIKRKKHKSKHKKEKNILNSILDFNTTAKSELHISDNHEMLKNYEKKKKKDYSFTPKFNIEINELYSESESNDNGKYLAAGICDESIIKHKKHKSKQKKEKSNLNSTLDYDPTVNPQLHILDKPKMLKNYEEEKKKDNLFTPYFNSEIEKIHIGSGNKGNGKHLTADVSDECVIKHKKHKSKHKKEKNTLNSVLDYNATAKSELYMSDNSEMLKNYEKKKKKDNLFTPYFNSEIEKLYTDTGKKGNGEHLTADVSDECAIKHKKHKNKHKKDKSNLDCISDYDTTVNSQLHTLDKPEMLKNYEKKKKKENLFTPTFNVEIDELSKKLHFESGNKDNGKYLTAGICDESIIKHKKHKSKKKKDKSKLNSNLDYEPTVNSQLHILDEPKMLKNYEEEKKKDNLFTPNFNSEIEKLCTDSGNKCYGKYLTADVHDECVIKRKKHKSKHKKDKNNLNFISDFDTTVNSQFHILDKPEMLKNYEKKKKKDNLCTPNFNEVDELIEKLDSNSGNTINGKHLTVGEFITKHKKYKSKYKKDENNLNSILDHDTTELLPQGMHKNINVIDSVLDYCDGNLSSKQKKISEKAKKTTSSVNKKHKKDKEKKFCTADVDENSRCLNNSEKQKSTGSVDIDCLPEDSSADNTVHCISTDIGDNLYDLENPQLPAVWYNTDKESNYVTSNTNNSFHSLSNSAYKNSHKQRTKCLKSSTLNTSEFNGNNAYYSDLQVINENETSDTSVYSNSMETFLDKDTQNSTKIKDLPSEKRAECTYFSLRDWDFIEDPINFEVPLLHKFETARRLNEKQKNDLLASGVFIKKGKFTKAEDKIIERNFKDFVEKYGISDPFTLLGIGRYKKDLELLKFLKVQHFYVRLAKDLNDRSLSSVYKRARIILHPFRNSKKLTENEISYLKKLHVSFGNKWHYIAETLGKSAEKCIETYRWHEKDIAKGQFTKEEETQLIEALKRVSGGSDFSCKNMKGISWETVASYVPSRNSTQCRTYWAYNLAWAPGSAKKNWNRQCYCRLIRILKEMNVERSSMIDWDKVYESFEDCAPSVLYVQKRWLYLRSRVSNYVDKSHKQIVNILCDKYSV